MTRTRPADSFRCNAHMRIASGAMFAAAWLVLAGCQLFGANEPPRIQFGRSIDGVEIGDDTTTVVAELGRPDYVGLGDFTGVIFSYAYPIGDGPGFRDSLMVAINTNPRDDEFGVIAVTARGPYTGTTAGGIGIGSLRSGALDVWGPPEESREGANERKDFYHFRGNAFEITYSDDRIHSIEMHRSRTNGRTSDGAPRAFSTAQN